MPSLVDFRHRANTEVNICQGHSILRSSAWIITGRKITAIFIKYQSFRKKIDCLSKSKPQMHPVFPSFQFLLIRLKTRQRNLIVDECQTCLMDKQV